MKIKSNYFKKFAVALLGASSLAFYSCGTEVGNGHSRPSIDGLTTKNHEDRSPSENSTSEGTAQGGQPSADAVVAAEPNMAIGAKDVVRALLNSCQSPLLDFDSTSSKIIFRGSYGISQTPEANANLAIEIGEQPAANGTRHWDVNATDWDDSAQLYQVYRDSAGVFSVVSADETQSIAVPKTCQGPLEETQVKIPGSDQTFAKRTVNLVDDGQTLSWYILSQEVGTSVEQLELHLGDEMITLKKAL